MIRPVLTRWTAYYLAYERLLVLREVLECIVISDEHKAESEKQVITGSREARKEAKKMVDIIRNPLFWYNLLRHDLFHNLSILFNLYV